MAERIWTREQTPNERRKAFFKELNKDITRAVAPYLRGIDRWYEEMGREFNKSWRI